MKACTKRALVGLTLKPRTQKLSCPGRTKEAVSIRSPRVSSLIEGSA